MIHHGTNKVERRGQDACSCSRGDADGLRTALLVPLHVHILQAATSLSFTLYHPGRLH